MSAGIADRVKHDSIEKEGMATNDVRPEMQQ